MSFKNIDSPLYYRAAREAARYECEGEYHHAAKVWQKASLISYNDINQQWSENRAEFCLKQIEREKLKSAFSDNLKTSVTQQKAAGYLGDQRVRHRLRVYVPSKSRHL